MPIAIIDLGSNTFKLLIAELSSSREINIIHESIHPCMLAKNATQKNIISEEYFSKGMENISEIFKIINSYKPIETYIYATSIIRSSTNGNEFVEQIEKTFSVKVEIIDGDREAELVYEGTKHAIELNHEKVAIVDIGGGSCEIIIADNKKIYWKKSFDLGVRRILELFNPSDPISKPDHLSIQKYIQESIQELNNLSEIHNVKTLVGTAGSFDTLRKVLKVGNKEDNSCEIKLKDFFLFHQEIMKSDNQQRRNMSGIIEARAELMVVASIFIKEILTTLDVTKMYQSSFSLKEGAFFENINK